MDSWLILLHFASTLFMTGLIWFVQVVHYPLFAKVGDKQFPAYENAHTTRTGWVVGPPMLIEITTAVAIWFLIPAVAATPAFVWSLAALAVIWISTACLQIPLHRSLTKGGSPKTIAKLVSSNWIRTFAWSARSLLLAGIALDFIRR